MEILNLTENDIDACVGRAVKVLREGGVILYPTDTLYGLGADAFSDEAVAQVYDIKGRDERKPIHAIVADIGMVEEYAEMSADARLLAQNFLPGALTLVLKKKSHLEHGIGRGIETIGFRIPDNAFCAALARSFDAPFTTTSANVAGMPSERFPDAILRQLATAATGIGLLIDAGELPERAPSTVVDCSGPETVILREGAIEVAEIWNALSPEA